MGISLPAAADLDVACRPMTDADLAFVAAVYASTRLDELARTGWPPEQMHAFLAHQHHAQHEYYRAHYPGAEWLIVEREGQPIGRLYLVEWERELRIIDISLMPSARGGGIGGAILADVIAAARAVGKKVSIHVEQDNRARGLYVRLGFEPVEQRGVYTLMEWPGGTAPA